MLAVSFDVLTKVVARGLPFQFTTERDVNPVPVTVRVNPGPPGMALVGTKGWSMYGTALAAAAVTIATQNKKAAQRIFSFVIGTSLRVMDPNAGKQNGATPGAIWLGARRGRLLLGTRTGLSPRTDGRVKLQDFAVVS